MSLSTGAILDVFRNLCRDDSEHSSLVRSPADFRSDRCGGVELVVVEPSVGRGDGAGSSIVSPSALDSADMREKNLRDYSLGNCGSHEGAAMVDLGG